MHTRDVEDIVKKRLATARKQWEIEAEAAAQEWRKRVEELAKLDAEIEARAKIESERKAALAAEAALEAKRKEEEALKKKMLEEAMLQAEQALKRAEKPPIKFKDAVGRKFSFPFHLCQTWTVSMKLKTRKSENKITETDIFDRAWKTLSSKLFYTLRSLDRMFKKVITI